jgi:phosphonate transport system substrate-binding protein
MRRAVLFLTLGLFLSAVFSSPAESSGTQNGPQWSGPPPLVFIIPPVENVSAMYEQFLPLKEYIEKEISRPITLEIARNYQEAISDIGTGKAGLAFLDPSAYCEARHLHKVVPLAKTVLGGSSRYRSVIVARKDSPIDRIAEGKGMRLALGNTSSSSSYLIPAVMFKEVGLVLDDFASVGFLENEDRIALSVLTRKHDLGGMSERIALKYLDDGLKIIRTSEAIPQYSICASSKLPRDVRDKIRKALLSVNSDRTPGLIAAMKGLDGFAPVEDRDFDVVRVMIRNLTGENYLEYRKGVVKVAILPLYSAITLFERFDPLMRYLTLRTGREFKLVIPKDFEDFFRTVKEGKVEFSYSNPYIYIQLADRKFLSAFANTILRDTGDIFRGIIITHVESAIKDLEDLRGKNVMVVSYRSAGGFLAQRLLLDENGIDVYKDLKMSEGKRQEEVILNVYRRNVDAGFVRESALNVLEGKIDLGKIRILAATPYISNWPFAATRSAEGEMTELVQKSLVELKDESILGAAHVKAFKPATDREFDSLRKSVHAHDHE